MKIEIKIVIDGKEYTKEDARKIYYELKEVFDPTIVQYPTIFESPKHYGPIISYPNTTEPLVTYK